MKKEEEIEITRKFMDKVAFHFKSKNNQKFSHYFNYIANKDRNLNDITKGNFCDYCFEFTEKKTKKCEKCQNRNK
jgi:recombinational DNA repair protein RecR